MKKILSIILCLSMLMTSAVFAAPISFAPIEVESAVEIDPIPAGDEIEEAELSALPALAPVSAYPANGASNVSIGDPAYKVTFDKAINPEDVTIENLGVSSAVVNAVWYDEATCTVYLFPDVNALEPGAVISFPEIKSNIPTVDGTSNLYFPAVSYTIGTSHGDDGKNMFPYSNSEYGWLSATSNKIATLVEDGDGNKVIEISANSGKEWLYCYFPAVFEANTEYKFSYKVKGVKINPEISFNASDDIRDEANFMYTDGGSTENHTGVGFVNIKALDTWYEVSGTHTTTTPDSTKNHKFGAYMEPPYKNNTDPGYSLTHYIDDVEVYKKVKVSFAAGNNTILTGTAPKALFGYNGDTVILPSTDAFSATDSRWIMVGWTDGEETYNVGEEYTVNGAKTLTPYVFALEDTHKVTFSGGLPGSTLPEEFEIFDGDTVDLTASKYKVSATGYWFDGWAVKGTDEIITSITPTADIELVAKFSYTDYWDFTNKAHYDMMTIGGSSATSVYDAENGAVITPLVSDNMIETGKKPVTFEAEDYSKAEVTLVKTAKITESLCPQLFFLSPEDTSATPKKCVSGTFDRYEGENNKFIVYSFNMSSNANWTGALKSFGFDPYNATDPWTIKSLRFIKKHAIESVTITGIDAPVVRTAPDTTAVVPSNAKYTVSSVVWSPEVSGMFGAETEYTVNITLAPTEGNRFVEDAVVTVNGMSAEIKVNADRTATVSYKFPATEALIPVTVTADKSVNTIDVNEGTLNLSATVATVNPNDVIDTDEIIWSVDNENIAEIKENILYALDNGTVTVTAASEYDPDVTDSFTVTISNQTLYTVKFDAGTKDTAVTNLPADINCRRTLDLTKIAAPERAGHIFVGWKTATYAEETVTSILVEEDTTLYASWAEGVLYDFYTIPSEISFNKLNVEHDAEKGLLKITTNAIDPQMYINKKYNASNKTGGVIDGRKYSKVEIRLASMGATGRMGAYFTSVVPETGEVLSRGWAEGDSTYANTFVSQPVKNTSLDDFYTITLDYSGKTGWTNGIIDHLRIDPPDPVGGVCVIDYIRMMNHIEEYVDITVDTPVAMAEAATTAVALASGKFEVKSLEWEQELYDGKYFYGNTAYTANIVVAAKSGVKIADTAVATVNGNEAVITNNGDGTYTIKYIFPATETLSDVKVVVDETNNAISAPDGFIELSAQVVDVATEEPIDNQNIVWSIDNTAICEIDGNKLTAIDNGEVTVTAVSEYDRTKTASYVITITNQIPPRTLTFNAGTGATVTGMPETFKGKNTIDLAQFGTPEREGYVFIGWTLSKGGTEIVSKVDLNKDTTLYALWKKGIFYEFNTDGDFEGFPKVGQVSEIGVKDGCYYFKSNGDDPNGVLKGLSIDASIYKTIEIKISSNVASDVQIFFAGTNASSISEANSKSVAYNALPEGEFEVITFDMSDMADWTGTIDTLRFDLARQRDVSVKIDYVRISNSVNEYVDITGIDVPVAKAVADLTADSADETKYTVKNIEWEPSLLHELYHYGNTQYTVNVTVAPALGEEFSEAPVATVNGNEAKVAKVNADGSVVVSYTFPEITGEIDNTDAETITLVSKDDNGDVRTTKIRFVGETFELDAKLVAAWPKGMRWMGWAETDGDLSTVKDSIVTEKREDRVFYAQYEKITEYDFSNKYRGNFKIAYSATTEGITKQNGALIIGDASEASGFPDVVFDGLALDTVEYAAVEVVFDAELSAEDFADNYVGMTFMASGKTFTILSSKMENVTDDGRKAYKYTFYPVNDDLWLGEFNEFHLEVEAAYGTKIALRSIKFIPTKAVTVTLSGATVISRPGRIEGYSASVKALDGTSIPRTDITTEIVKIIDTNGNPVAKVDYNKYAIVDAKTGKLSPVSDCTVTLRGTSNYNKRAYDEMDVSITNQGNLCNVIYDLNGVTGTAPANGSAKGAFTPAACTATRNGYFFAGWSLDPDDASGVSNTFNITEDTTLYAIWSKFTGYEFNTDGNFEGFPEMGSSKDKAVKDGCYTFTSTTNDPNCGFYGSYNLDADKIKTIEVRMSSSHASHAQIFFDSEKAVSESRSFKLNTKANADGEFTTYTFDMGSVAGWGGTIKTLRFDFVNVAGATVKVDYIRFIYGLKDIKLNANGGVFTTTDDEIAESVLLGSYTIPYTPVKAGNKLVGWSRKADGSGKVYTGNSVMVADDVTFYAIWAPTVDTTDTSKVTYSSGTGNTKYNGSNGLESDFVDAEPVVSVTEANDSITIGDSANAILINIEYNYSSMTDNNLKIRYTDAAGQPQEVPVMTLPNSAKAGYLAPIKLTGNPVNLANGDTISNLEIVLPTGTGTSVLYEMSVMGYANANGIYNDFMTAENTKVDVSIADDKNSNPKTYAPATQPENVPGTIGGGQPAGAGVGNNNNSTAGGTGNGTTMTIPAVDTGNGIGTSAINIKKIASNFKFKNQYNANTFNDVKSGDWFYGDVEKSYKLGLMNGKGGTTFDPNGAVTIAEAVTVSARIHAICVGKNVADAKSGEAWYTPYVNYAIDAKIIKSGQFADYTVKATRKQVAQIFANCAPEGWLNVINIFASIPDVDSKDVAFNAILSLYNAGILTGVDATYKFNPDADIKRSEMSAIINRVALLESRIRVLTDVEKNEAPFINLTTGDDITNTGFYVSTETFKLTSVEDPDNSTNKVFQVETIKDAKVWTYIWHKMKYKAGRKYKIDFDIRLVSGYNGASVVEGTFGLCANYGGKDHGFGGGTIKAGEWIHISKELTIPKDYTFKPGDKFGIYMDPINEKGVVYMVDNISVVPLK